MNVDLAPAIAVVGLLSTIMGAIGAGVGVYITTRLEIERNKGAFEKAVAVLATRLELLEEDVKVIGAWARQNTK